VGGGDVGVPEGSESPGLAPEARHPFGVAGVLFPDPLERHLQADPGVAGPVDLPRPALAEEGQDLVGADAGAAAERRGLGPAGGLSVQKIGGNTARVGEELLSFGAQLWVVGTDLGEYGLPFLGRALPDFLHHLLELE